MKIDNISKSFLQTDKSYLQALANISFEMKPGEITGLIGLNGAGKTTLIKIMAGLYKHDEGYLQIDLKKSLLSAGQGIYKNLKVCQLINYIGLLQNKTFDINKYEIQELIHFLNLESFLDKKIETLSAGWKQKILILLTFFNDPELILLDEPSSFLDFHGQKQLDELIYHSKHKGKYVLLTSHNLNEIEKKSDNILFLDKGKQVFFETKESITNRLLGQSFESFIYKYFDEEKR